MKSVLPEWYVPNDDEMKDFVTSGTVALDANVLLDLYRISEDQRSKVLGVLRQVQDRLWVPYQFALEYQRNRLLVVSDLDKGYQALATGIEQLAESALKDVRDSELRSLLAHELVRAQKKLNKRMVRIWAEHFVSVAEARHEDPIRVLLDDLLGPGHVGAKPVEDVLKTRRAEAEMRYEKKIPPGYCDVGKKADPSGDYLAWCELLEYAAASDKPLLLVTNDSKEDWYQQQSGEKLGPRPELVREMLDGNARYHHTTLDGFLRQANRFIADVVDDETIEAVEALSTEAAPLRSASDSRLADAYFDAGAGRGVIRLVGAKENVTTSLGEAFRDAGRDPARIGLGNHFAAFQQSPEFADAMASIVQHAISDEARESMNRAVSEIITRGLRGKDGDDEAG